MIVLYAFFWIAIALFLVATLFVVFVTVSDAVKRIFKK